MNPSRTESRSYPSPSSPYSSRFLSSLPPPCLYILLSNVAFIAPPDYFTIFGQIREAREESSSNLVFLKRLGQIVLNTGGKVTGGGREKKGEEGGRKGWKRKEERNKKEEEGRGGEGGGRERGNESREEGL